jgi:hypothetical protein
MSLLFLKFGKGIPFWGRWFAGARCASPSIGFLLRWSFF